jgi:hypothetical protein
MIHYNQYETVLVDMYHTVNMLNLSDDYKIVKGIGQLGMM